MLLSIDTCGSSGSVALARVNPSFDSLEILAQTNLPGKTYSAELVPAIRDLLAAHNVAIAAIAIIVVTSGPGSFTGIRIGLSTAKGLAEVLATPIVAVSRLAVLAHKAQNQVSQDQNSQISAAALDASRGEFYFGDHSSPVSEERLLPREAFVEQAAALAHRLAVCERSVLAVAPAATLVPAPTAADALLFALPRLRAHDYDDPLTLDGNYLRRSDAEIFSKPKASPATAP
jgi:tRNA threonylcarbamoyladenosine biosynthesis protein TsaB